MTRKHRGLRVPPRFPTADAPAKNAASAKDANVSDVPSLHLPNVNPPRKRLWLLLLAALLWSLCIAALTFVAMS